MAHNKITNRTRVKVKPGKDWKFERKSKASDTRKLRRHIYERDGIMGEVMYVSELKEKFRIRGATIPTNSDLNYDNGKGWFVIID